MNSHRSPTLRSGREFSLRRQVSSRRAPAARILVLALLTAFAGAAAIVDRVAVVVGKTVITETEVLQEVRLTQFLNQEPLDLGPEARRAAAERLVDQQLIRNEMQIGGYPQPSPSEAEDVLNRYRQENYPSAAAFRAALEKYGITEEQLKQHLLWQQAALQFTEVRFRPDLQMPAAAGTDHSAGSVRETEPQPGRIQSANRLRAGAAAPAGNSVDQQMDAWLKEARANTKIQMKKEAFQ
jgi:hypothetical protein